MSEQKKETSRCAILIKELPSEFEDIALLYYLENISDNDKEVYVQDVNHSKAIAIAEFEYQIDIVSLQKKAHTKPFCGQILSFEVLEPLNKVVVKGIPSDTSLDSLVLQYEALVIDDGVDETASFICSDNSTAVITFQNARVVEPLLATKHQISGCDVTVEPWRPTWQNPDDIPKRQKEISNNKPTGAPLSGKKTQSVKPQIRVSVSKRDDAGSHDDKLCDVKPTEETDSVEDTINSAIKDIAMPRKSRSVSRNQSRSSSRCSSEYNDDPDCEVTDKDDSPFSQGNNTTVSPHGTEGEHGRPASRPRGRSRRRRGQRGQNWQPRGGPNNQGGSGSQQGNYQNPGGQNQQWHQSMGRGWQGGQRGGFHGNANNRGRGNYRGYSPYKEDPNLTPQCSFGRVEGRQLNEGYPQFNPQRNWRGNSHGNNRYGDSVQGNQDTKWQGRETPNTSHSPRGKGRGRGQPSDPVYHTPGGRGERGAFSDQLPSPQDQREMQSPPFGQPYSGQREHQFSFKEYMPDTEYLSHADMITKTTHPMPTASAPQVKSTEHVSTKESGIHGTDQEEFKEEIQVTGKAEKLKLLQLMKDDKLNQLKQNFKIDFSREKVFVADREVKMHLLEIFAQMFDHPLRTITQSFGAFLIKEKEKPVQQKLRAANITGIMFMKSGGPCVLGINDKDAMEAENVINRAISVKEFVVDQQQMHMLKQSEWKTAVKSFKDDVLIEETLSKTSVTTITLCGIEPASVASAMTCLQEMLKENAKNTKQILLEEKGVWLFLQRRCSLESITMMKEEEMKRQNLKVMFKKSLDGGYLVNISGFSTDVDTTANKLQKDICPKIKTHNIPFTKPGIHYKQFVDTKEKIQLDQIEKHNSCIIHVVPGSGHDTQARQVSSGHNSQDDLALKWARQVSPELEGAVGGELTERIQGLESSSGGLELISILKGNITETQADLLVCSVLADAASLSQGGAVSKAFLTVGGKALEMSFQGICSQHEGCLPIGQVEPYIVESSSKLRCRLIAFVAVKHYRPDHGRQFSALKKMVAQCLDVAQQYGLRSIAFPTIGCGGLKFPPREVADCFKKAVIEWKMKGKYPLQITVVAYDDAAHGVFQDVFSPSAVQRYTQPRTEQAYGKQGKYPEKVGQKVSFPSVTFTITVMDSKTLTVVKKQLESLVEGLVDQDQIVSKSLCHLSSEQRSQVQSHQSSRVSLVLNEKSGKIKLEGEKAAVVEVKAKLEYLVRQAERAYEQTKMNPEYIKAKHGQSGYLTAMAQDTSVPSHWTNFTGNKLVDAIKKMSGKTRKVAVSPEMFKAVESLVMKSWQGQFMGMGRDARGQRGSGVTVHKVWQIEDPQMFHGYQSKRAKFCIQASKQRYIPINSLKGEKEVVTRTHGERCITELLVPDINEYFMFHGTKAENAEAIAKQGLDSRIGNTGGMFGKGVYFAESATKADQYAAPDRTNRLQYMNQMALLGRPSSGGGNSKHMFLCRVLLGSAYLCQAPQPYMRPPCLNCCPGHCTHDQFFDSVIGLSNGSTRLNFREFIVYEKDQCYPDFWIEYDTV